MSKLKRSNLKEIVPAFVQFTHNPFTEFTVMIPDRRNTHGVVTSTIIPH